MYTYNTFCSLCTGVHSKLFESQDKLYDLQVTCLLLLALGVWQAVLLSLVTGHAASLTSYMLVSFKFRCITVWKAV